MAARAGIGTTAAINPVVAVGGARFIYGTDNADVLHGSDELNNVILAYGGNDMLFGLAGDDTLFGGAGADHLDGGSGIDTANYTDSNVGVTVNLARGFGRYGTAEGDTLVDIEKIAGSEYGDTLIGNDGDNRLFGMNGNDHLTGGLGPDILVGGDSLGAVPGLADGGDTAVYSDSPVGVTVNLATGRGFGGTAEGDTFVSIEHIDGSLHNDVLSGSDDANFLYGAGGDDIVKGVGGADILYGAGGNDTLKGGGGADVLEGGIGIDTASYTDLLAGVFVSLITDTADFGDAEGDQIFNIENLTGTAFHDDLWGDDGVNAINGMAGNDTLKGFGGDDLLNGETGVDTMFGALGSDTYLVDNAGDIVRETGGEGNDTVQSSVSYTLTAGSDVETLRTTNDAGTAAIDLTGNANGNVVIGNNGNNTVNGGNGNDELTGRGGQDGFLFDTPLNGASNVDRITDFSVADDTILLDRDIFSSSLGLGTIADGEFVIGAAAQDANDRIIYNNATGAVLYDADGVGGNAAVQFAALSTGLALTNLDFLVVA